MLMITLVKSISNFHCYIRAYKILSDSEMRNRYDNGLSIEDDFEDQSVSMMDIAQSMYTAYKRTDKPKVSHAETSNLYYKQLAVEVDFLVCALGGTVNIECETKESCTKCEGIGSTTQKICKKCKGKGIIQASKSTCDACKGLGRKHKITCK